MKKIKHTKLPITLESSDKLDYDMLEAISLNMEYDMWSAWNYVWNNFFVALNEKEKREVFSSEKE